MGGPPHIIACQKTATETQTTGFLGISRCDRLERPFGVYGAENVQKVQFVFVVNRRDETRTRHAAQRSS